MFSNLILPFILFSVSIFASNLFIFFIIAISHPKDFSNLNLSKFLFQFLLIFLFIKGPLQPLLLSYCSKPFLNAAEALVCKFKSIGVLILKPCL